MTVRIAPASPPYPEAAQEDLSKLMPPGMEPIALFRTLAKNPRVLRRFRRGALLDPGSITLRQRELIILRTTAVAGAEYEWGVHVAFFGAAAGFSAEQLHASVRLGPDAACWKPDEALLIRACDELHESAQLSDGLYERLRGTFSEAQLLELLVLAGLYRMISYVVNGTAIALEANAPRFPQ
jgi:alkylhydroperoxidase family enzyme